MAELTFDPAAPETAQGSPAVGSRPYLRLFLISFVLLFAELACIRWFGSTVILLTYFTNIVLMACVLGMSVGCLAAARERNWIDAVLPVALVAVALACWTLRAYDRGEMSIAAGDQNSPQEIFFGAESVKAAPAGRTYPIEALTANAPTEYDAMLALANKGAVELTIDGGARIAELAGRLEVAQAILEPPQPDRPPRGEEPRLGVVRPCRQPAVDRGPRLLERAGVDPPLRLKGDGPDRPGLPQLVSETADGDQDERPGQRRAPAAPRGAAP